ncbi:hypothetical protein tb265_39240 [Gemmatimonadetes bacterium T265]|nr:hypothetical protein tb265_39240 [Gemmatimonadetes bacterium T265]
MPRPKAQDSTAARTGVRGVYRQRGVGGAVTICCVDGRGELIAELRFAPRHCDADIEASAWAWLDRHDPPDAQPGLRLLS